MKKLVRPSSRLFYKFKKYPRNIDIFTGIVGKKGLVHDGYSWHLITFNKSLLAFKIGSLCFRTRVVSPVKIYEKGKDGLEMSQQNTYRIRHIKVRRKK